MDVSTAGDRIRFELGCDDARVLAMFLQQAKFGGSPRPEIFTHPIMNRMLRDLSSFLEAISPDHCGLEPDIGLDDPIDAAELDPNTMILLNWLEAHRPELSDAEIADILFPFPH